MKNKFILMIFALVALLLLPVAAFAEDTTGENVITVIASENVDLYINGDKAEGEVEITAEDELMFVSDALVIKTENGYYLPNEVFYIEEDTDLSSAQQIECTGLTMVNGAQVRVGKGELEEGAKIDSSFDSGLRFIATADYSGTLVSGNDVEFGIKISAQDSDKYVYIKAEKFQDEEKTVFTAAITNLSTSNYNRKYKATTYAKINLYDGTELEFNNGEITRSIYQVSAGLMKQGSADTSSDLEYIIDDTVKNVLNAYINQTGVRLSFVGDGTLIPRTNSTGAYTGDVFFDVQSSLNDDYSIDVVITPYTEDDDFNVSVTIADWWEEYIRINNNNSAVRGYISDEKLEDGVLSFKFTLPGYYPYKFDQERNVMVVSSITDTSITGFEAGVEVTYEFAPKVTVLGLSNSIDDVIPGSVVLIGTDLDEEYCAAIELLATIGLPVDTNLFEESMGVHMASDYSEKYENILGVLYSKGGSTVTVLNRKNSTRTAYSFVSSSPICYRVGIAMEDGAPVVTVSGSKVTAYPSIFESTANYNNYMYMRYNTQTGKVDECVYYCVPKNLDYSGDDEYSGIFSLKNRITIIE